MKISPVLLGRAGDFVLWGNRAGKRVRLLWWKQAVGISRIFSGVKTNERRR